MAHTHNLGFPRIGAHRELKFSLEKYWKRSANADEVSSLAAELRRQNWKRQQELDWVPVGDFSLYDQVLDTSTLLGNVPERATALGGSALDAYFRVARRKLAPDSSRVHIIVVKRGLHLQEALSGASQCNTVKLS